ncbi:nuclear transport factor 2 family protein [Saccharomonospora sp. NPDC046836]|uniref:nuclear transport factor 2 family protein n=1 Tax=Saccharomonospora sp. NPDC046836 TaxID=3156921 RepID=UPI0033E60DED
MVETVLTVEERMARLEARAAISELTARYCRSLDQRDREAFGELWAEDAVQELRDRGIRFEGRGQILEGFDNTVRSLAHTHHLTGNLAVELLSDTTARGVCDVLVATLSAEGEGWLTAATYEDRLRRDGDRWVFVARVVHDRVGGPLAQLGPTSSAAPQGGSS